MMFDYTQQPGRERNRRYQIRSMERPLLSVVTPYYNGGAYFEQTMNSVLNQTFPWFEWIIVNDGSTNADDVALLERLSAQDARLRVVHQENQGATAARKHGIRESQSDYIFLLDADDLIDCRYFEMAYLALERNPGATWAYADSVGFLGQEYLWVNEFSSQQMKKENLLPYASLLRKSVFDDETVYPDESRNRWEDYQLWLRLLAKGCYPVHIQLPLFWYRRLDSGELAKIERDPATKRELEKKIRSLAAKVPDGIRAVTFGGKRTAEFKKPAVWAEERALPFAAEKTRILLLIPHMECGGADKFNLDVLKHLNRERYEIGVVTTVPAESEWRQEFQKYADDLFELPAFLDMNDWAGFLHHYVATRQVKIVWNISSYFAYYTLPWLRTAFPEVAIIDCIHAEGAYWRAGGYPRVSGAVDSVLEKTFVTNDFTRRVLVEKYGKPKEKTQVIYTGVDEREFDPDTIDGTAVRETYQLGNRPVVLYLCRLAAEKRPFLMLEIAKAVVAQIPDVCFLAVGGGPQLDELKTKAARMGLEKTVVFTGRVADTKPFYKAADLFLLCSLKEGLSITTMEAMLMKLPVVSADIASQYELVDEKTGRLIPCRQDEAADFDRRDFPPEEVADYAEAFCSLLANREALGAMGETCRAKMLDGYTLSVTMETLDLAFQALTSQAAVARRRDTAAALAPFSDLLSEFLTLYTEYETTGTELRGMSRLVQYIKDALTLKRSPISVLREVRQKKNNPIVKRLMKKLLNR